MENTMQISACAVAAVYLWSLIFERGLWAFAVEWFAAVQTSLQPD